MPHESQDITSPITPVTVNVSKDDLDLLYSIFYPPVESVPENIRPAYQANKREYSGWPRFKQMKHLVQLGIQQYCSDCRLKKEQETSTCGNSESTGKDVQPA